jgi:hypothetical protein
VWAILGQEEREHREGGNPEEGRGEGKKEKREDKGGRRRPNSPADLKARTSPSQKVWAMYRAGGERAERRR